MSAENLALAAEAVADKRWRWLPGMRASYHYSDERGFARLVWAKGNERGEWYMFPDGDREREPGMLRSGTRVVVPTLPDLDDAATLGCLLALVREAWGCDEWRRLTVEPAGKGWTVVLRNARHRPPSRANGGWDLDAKMHPRYSNEESPLPRYSNKGGPFGVNEFPTEAAALVAALRGAP